MPQEFHVIRCYSCQTFQVHIVKKSNKWDCKMCGEKQSLKKVYFQGSGKDCRLNVQKLNETRILNELKTDIPENTEIVEIEQVNENSKWDEYLSKHNESSDDEVNESIYTFNRPNNKRKSLTKNTNEIKKIKMKSEDLVNTNQNENTNISKWKSFMMNIEKQSENILKETSNNKINLSPIDVNNDKKSKWNCFINNEKNDEIPDPEETNVSLNIFNSDDDNLDYILQI